MNRQLDPSRPATKRWVTVSGILLGLIVIVNFAAPLPDWIAWPARVGLIALWLVDEFSAHQAWRLHEKARSQQANRVALKVQRDALVRECLGRAYLFVVYITGVHVFDPATHWFLQLIAGAGAIYICWLILAFVRIESQMSAGPED